MLRKKKPDFLVESPSHEQFYMEAVIATGESEKDSAARARMNVLYDEVDRLISPNFFIGMRMSGLPKTPPPAKKIRAFLKKRVAPLNPDDVAERFKTGGFNAIPNWCYEHKGWRIKFFPIPKSAVARGKIGMRTLGIQMPEIKLIDSRIALKNAIVKKASKYGNFNLPYVVAVNTVGKWPIEKVDIMEALFGKEQFTAKITQSGLTQTGTTRKPDGVWTGRSRPRYTRVSAVLVAIQLYPWNIPQTNICLYHNPYAKRPLISELSRLSQAVPQDDRMLWQDGEPLEKVFDLPSGWPDK